MLHELMRELGCAPERTLMVGDTTHDLQLAATPAAPASRSASARTATRSSPASSRLHVAHSTADLAAGWRAMPEIGPCRRAGSRRRSACAPRGS
jgi:phosphoglycolate phosphatase-like HAD superfamily hydrolase